MKRTKYPNREAVMAAILQRQDSGLPLNSGAVVRDDQTLVKTARRIFGSWGAAIEAAGLNYEAVRRPQPGKRSSDEWQAKYPAREDVILAILCRHAAGLPLNSTALESDDLPLIRKGRRLFGSWQAAIEAAGLDYNTVRRCIQRGYWSRERVLAFARARLMAGRDMTAGRVLSEHPQLYGAAVNYWGSWEAVVRELGLDYDQVRKKTSGPRPGSSHKRRQPAGPDDVPARGVGGPAAQIARAPDTGIRQESTW